MTGVTNKQTSNQEFGDTTLNQFDNNNSYFNQSSLKGRTETFNYLVSWNPLLGLSFTDPNVPNVPFNFNFSVPLPEIQTQQLMIIPKRCSLIKISIIRGPLGTNTDSVELFQNRNGIVKPLTPVILTNTTAIISPPLTPNTLLPNDVLQIVAPAGTFITYTIKYN